MSNPLYNQMNNEQADMGMIQKFNQFRNSFSGDPREMIQRMLNSGRITQEQYNMAVKKAQAMKGLFGIK